MSWLEEKGREGEVNRQNGEMTVEREGYKTHLSSMEKVKAHDRYKHICYWVVLYFWRSWIRYIYTGRFVWFDVWPCPAFILQHSGLALLFCKCTTHIHKTKTPFLFLQMHVNTTPDPLVVVLQSAVRNRQVICGKGFSMVQWKHTLLRTHKRDAGYYYNFFFF